MKGKIGSLRQFYDSSDVFTKEYHHWVEIDHVKYLPTCIDLIYSSARLHTKGHVSSLFTTIPDLVYGLHNLILFTPSQKRQLFSHMYWLKIFIHQFTWGGRSCLQPLQLHSDLVYCIHDLILFTASQKYQISSHTCRFKIFIHLFTRGSSSCLQPVYNHPWPYLLFTQPDFVYSKPEISTIPIRIDFKISSTSLHEVVVHVSSLFTTTLWPYLLFTRPDFVYSEPDT